MSRWTVCVDFGSTFTKAALVDLDDGLLLASAAHRTTVESDVMDGYDACRAALDVDAAVPALACSSAGGGLRLAVVGYERAITAEAGARVGVSAGARVVHVSAGPLDDDSVAALVGDRPDVVLLVGGTDGGNSETLLHNADRLARAALGVPVVAAGNADVAEDVVDVLASQGTPVVSAANVLPEIGRLDPLPARAAIREVFIRHVIGGKGLSRRPEFVAMVRAATPDAVLAGVELLADAGGAAGGVGDVLVIDIGGATTDVYSVVTPQGEDAVLRRDVVETLWRSRTVEGDLGMRSNATGIVEAALEERLLTSEGAEGLAVAARLRSSDPAYLPTDESSRDDEACLAELALTVAVRRHGRGKSLREVGLVVGSGGVLRHADDRRRSRILRPATSDHGGGWAPPTAVRVTVDRRYVLAAAGLLAADDRHAAVGLLRSSLS